MNDRLWIVLPCAGAGSRFAEVDGHVPEFATPAAVKQYAPLGNGTVLGVVLERMLELQPARIVLVVARGDEAWRRCVPEHGRDRIVSVLGGTTRSASVLNGVRALAGDAAEADWVMVHDVARPCITHAQCVRLLAAVANDKAGGLLAVPVTDTIKQGSGDGSHAVALRTIPRAGLWAAQTPQVFRFGVLHAALAAAVAATTPVTDEAGAVELLGLQPRLVPGSVENLKITWPEDLARAAAILAARSLDA